MKTFRWLAATAIALAAVPVSRRNDRAVRPSACRRSTRRISSDAFEGRGPATRAETKTINYIADQFKAAGLQPGGDMVNGQRSWFQDGAAAPVGDRRQRRSSASTRTAPPCRCARAKTSPCSRR